MVLSWICNLCYAFATLIRTIDAKSDPASLREMKNLELRLGPLLTRERLRTESERHLRLRQRGQGLLQLERYIPLNRIVRTVLNLCGLGKTARQNFLGVRIVERNWVLDRLPKEFNGFRLMQLSDLHIDLDPALVPVITELAKATPHDAAVLTGDYRNSMRGDLRTSMGAMDSIIRAIGSPRWGILGNHDHLEMVSHLEKSGLPILLNEAASIRRGAAELWFAGVDDPHYYSTHDIAAAGKKIPEGAFKILLSHSPEIAADAARAGFDLMLAGHTHGGQICLPGGQPIVLPVEFLPRDLVNGKWKRGSMQGYTSPGTGSCGVAARFHCPPEITIHILRRTPPAWPGAPEVSKNTGAGTKSEK